MTDREPNLNVRKIGLGDSLPPEDLGGKAHGLNVLRDMGYPVPDFYVIPFNQDVADPQVIAGIEKFLQKHGGIALRSSANIEDGENTSFAGQFESYLDVSAKEIPDRIFDIRNSIYSEHVRRYCEAMGIPSEDIKMNIIVQSFHEPIAGGVWMGSGQLGGRIEWVEGRGDAVVNGTAKPHVEVYDEAGALVADKTDTVIFDDTGKTVAGVCQEIQQTLGYDVDIEFCLTDQGIQLLQLRQVTRALESDELKETHSEEQVILGEAASVGTVTGSAYRLDLNGAGAWNPSAGNILIARATSPADMLQIMTASGVVTRMGGQLSHSAVVCRELGKPCVVGVDIEKIAHNAVITIDGKAGKVVLK